MAGLKEKRSQSSILGSQITIAIAIGVILGCIYALFFPHGFFSIDSSTSHNRPLSKSNLQVLSKLCHQPIIVYIPEHEHTKGGRGSGFIPIAEYGAEFGKGSWKGKPRKVVRLLYSGKNHYDLLV